MTSTDDERERVAQQAREELELFLKSLREASRPDRAAAAGRMVGELKAQLLLAKIIARHLRRVVGEEGEAAELVADLVRVLDDDPLSRAFTARH